MTLGLTGGLGCGKSTAVAMFARHGCGTMDSDAIIRDIVLHEVSVVDAIRKRFGGNVIGPSGQVDRARLAEIVFADAAALRWLENLLHPRVFAHWRARLESEPARSWVVEVPLLFEKSLQNWFDFTVGVASHPAVQLARLEQRGLPPPLARQRISQQLPLAQKIKLADFVLLNDGSLEFLGQQVARLAQSLKIT